MEAGASGCQVSLRKCTGPRQNLPRMSSPEGRRNDGTQSPRINTYWQQTIEAGWHCADSQPAATFKRECMGGRPSRLCRGTIRQRPRSSQTLIISTLWRRREPLSWTQDCERTSLCPGGDSHPSFRPQIESRQMPRFSEAQRQHTSAGSNGSGQRDGHLGRLEPF